VKRESEEREKKEEDFALWIVQFILYNAEHAAVADKTEGAMYTQKFLHVRYRLHDFLLSRSLSEMFLSSIGLSISPRLVQLSLCFSLPPCPILFSISDSYEEV